MYRNIKEITEQKIYSSARCIKSKEETITIEKEKLLQK